jgi:hypothetical protein
MRCHFAVSLGRVIMLCHYAVSLCCVIVLCHYADGEIIATVTTEMNKFTNTFHKFFKFFQSVKITLRGFCHPIILANF